MSKSRVLLVTNDDLWAQSLEEALNANGSFQFLGKTTNLMDAYNEAEAHAPDLALVAYEFTRLPEFETILALFMALKTRWLAVTDTRRKSASFESKTRLRNSGLFTIDVDDPLSSTLQLILSVRHTRNSEKPQRVIVEKREDYAFKDSLVLIGASTGGVDALCTVLSDYPDNCPPTLIVQHTGRGFGQGLVDLLNRRCAAQVRVAEHGLQLTHGMVCVAAGTDKHLNVDSGSPRKIRMTEGAPVSGHLPSVDALFRSGLPIARNVVAILLTGMGSDGAQGLLELRRAGAQTFVQDEKTSVVYGMPRIAWEIGAAQSRLPLPSVCSHILRACSNRVPVR